jgi:hypothetical protein
MIPTKLLVALDTLAQKSGPLWQLSPSVFVRSRADVNHATAPADSFFRCPACGESLGAPPQQSFECVCGEVWEKHGEIYDFRYPRD